MQTASYTHLVAEYYPFQTTYSCTFYIPLATVWNLFQVYGLEFQMPRIGSQHKPKKTWAAAVKPSAAFDAAC